jgi:CRISPR/Cas system-associated exonuclease Cas4 (RecB family)
MVFSQASLQDYYDCQRRFQLRYLLHLAWPAIESEPVLENEHHAAQGARFHRMIQQLLVGIPSQLIAYQINDPDLLRWWENFHRSVSNHNLVSLTEPKQKRFVEVSLNAPLAGSRLVAHCDLITIAEDGQAIIYDWKTSIRRPSRAWLAGRMQTRIYPYLLLKAGAYLNSEAPIKAEQISMIYWFAEFPEQPEIFQYSASQFQNDERTLQELLQEILHLPDNGFSLTDQAARCEYCTFRSYCKRGAEAGLAPEGLVGFESAEPEAIILDFEQIGEIPY